MERISDMVAPGKSAWYVLHVKPRTEKKVVEWLGVYRFFHHLPTCLKITRIQRRKVRTLLPLFRGYVFARLKPDERLKILQTNLVVHTILIIEPRKVIHQLRQIKNATHSSARVVKIAHNFKEGELVKITTGPLRGVEGRIKRDGPSATLCLNCDILGQSVEVAVPPEDLERVKSLA